jgi:hypothetical protein
VSTDSGAPAAAAVELRSVSYEEDGALLALADLAQVISDWDACRIVGGHMVSLHVALAGVDVAHRPTGDADLAAPVKVLADPALAAALRRLGYRKVRGNRLERDVGTCTAALDLLAPAQTSRAKPNVPAGEFSVDAFPELALALRSPGMLVTVHAALFAGPPLEPFTVAVPSIDTAIVLKACAGRPHDAIDLDRLLTAAVAGGVTLPPPPHDDKDVRLAVEFLHGPFVTHASEQRKLTVEQVIPRPEPREFLDL